jgi:membrane protease YdiL (CAAX protease family)
MAELSAPKSLDLTARSRAFLAFALLVAMTLPSLVTWLYFIVLVTDKDTHNVAQLAASAAGKVVQLVLPIVVVWLLEKRLPRPQRPRFDGILWGAAFGLLAAGAIFVLYYAGFGDSPMLASTPQRVREKVIQLGLNSLFEEYYYRWFVFGQLRKLLPFLPAAVISSLAFMAHHVILLNAFFPGYFFVATVPLSLCVAAGGAFWAWLYERTGTLYSAWVSHGIVDAAIFGLGWVLLSRA